MNAPTRTGALAADPSAAPIRFTLDGRPLEARPGETILECADRHGTAIPRLCHKDGYRPDGNCRACVVEIDGERTLAPSCCRAPVEGMAVKAGSERARASQRMVLELLLAEAPAAAHRPDSELLRWAAALGVGGTRFAPRARGTRDLSHPAMAVDLDACIRCGRCVRGCREEQVNDVIGYAWRGDAATIVFDQDDPMGASTCVACGECVQACPTGALMPKRLGAADGAPIDPLADDARVDSLCPFCGVGCQLTYHVRDGRIEWVEGRDGPANHGRLCVKGRFGFDYASSPERLAVPLVRRDGVPKDPRFERVPADWRDAFREASWEEAIAIAAGGLARIRDAHGPGALAGFGSAKGSNEEAYLFQKLVRTGFGTNNVDHCTRLCHASSVAALLEGIGSGAVSNQVSDVMLAEVILVIGANPTVNHPVAATWIKNAAKAGATLIVADPRRTELARHATHVLQFRPDTDVALLNALLHVVIDEGLVDRAFVEARTEDYEALAAGVRDCSPEAMAPVCGIDAATLREVARRFARSRGSMILWGMGVSQHVHGTDNARCLIALSLLTGQIGRPGTGLHPLRGQNNVQGASDAGLIPMMLPDYRPVGDADAAAAIERLWGTPIDRRPGLTVVEIVAAAAAGRIRGMYVMGENPAMSDPDLAHARAALASLEMLVVQDIFPTETAWLADVILPASAFPEKTGTFTNTDRMVQLAREAVRPPGQARQDLAIVVDMARGLGLDWRYDHPREVFDEMRLAMDSIRGITWERLEREGSVTYPCAGPEDPGSGVVFGERFPTPSGRARLVPAGLRFADERPDADWPTVLLTGRQLEHWHTGSMTRRARVLDATEPEATASMNRRELARLGVAPGEPLRIASRRGEIVLAARLDDGLPDGAVFVPFAYAEAAANLLTNPALDPQGRIPELKYCAVRVSAAGAAAGASVQ
ncbi:MAG TPA: formate dehydrogenase subunit alpha [Burkholderiaceae bacterium]|nr:formate dehydrogenase subunit alpha [Burkholderiaceae bacterium]